MHVYRKRQVDRGFVIDLWDRSVYGGEEMLVEHDVLGVRPDDCEIRVDATIEELNRLGELASITERM